MFLRFGVKIIAIGSIVTLLHINSCFLVRYVPF